MSDELHGIESPDDSANIRTGEPKTAAAGPSSVIATLRHVAAEAGLVRGTQALLRVNQKEGFDCQSCAWPNPEDHRHVAEFCENGAKAVAAEVTTRRITAEFFRTHSIDALGAQSDHWLNAQGRLTEPVVRRDGSRHYEPISWDEAFSLIASELNALRSPDEAVFYTSGRTSNEAAFLYQLFVRHFGTNNLPDCSDMCHESSGAALAETIGVGKGTVTLEDFEHTGAIFILGQNPGTNHPRMMSALQKAKRQGAKIVSINPLPEAGLMRFRNPQEVSGLFGSGTPLSDLFLQVRINGDMAVLKGMARRMVEQEQRRPGGVLDRSFIEENTQGFGAYAAALREVSWESIVEESGVSRELIEQAADIAIASKATICCWAMGLTQHRNAVGTIQEIVNFLLLRGNIGRPGAGVCPVRGHSNVQGDKTMGIWERPAATFLDALAREFSFEPPREHGLDTVETIRAMRDGQVKVFFAMGGNFLSATPDTRTTARALQRCRLTVQASTKLNRAHLITGRTALILPCLGRSERDVQSGGEQFVTVEDSMGVISPSRGSFPPASEKLLSEPAIVARLARATLGPSHAVDWEAMAGDYRRIRDHISRVVPGFEDFNSRIALGSFVLPNAARTRIFSTSSGKAHFTVQPLPHRDLREDELVMMTIRSHDQFNTTIYGLDDRYRGIYNGRRVILMNREDAAERGLADGATVDITSHFGGELRVARSFCVVLYDIPRRCAATYFPEANVLVPLDAVADKSNTPISKSVIISVAPAAGGTDESGTS
jgi:molybdopterin-dependent oxidoreductase alpha subunit